MASFERTYPINEIVGELLPAGLSPEAFAVSLAWDAAAREGIRPVGRPTVTRVDLPELAGGPALRVEWF